MTLTRTTGAGALVAPAYDIGPVEGVARDAVSITLTFADLFPPSRKVMVIEADADTNDRLRAWCLAAGFDLGADYDGNPRDPVAFDFHLTLFATVEAVAFPDLDLALRSLDVDPVSLVPTGFEVLGVERQVPVLRLGGGLDLSVCAGIRDTMLSALAATPTFAEWKPHVSLSYAWLGSPRLSELRAPTFPIVFDRVRLKTLD